MVKFHFCSFSTDFFCGIFHAFCATSFYLMSFFLNAALDLKYAVHTSHTGNCLGDQDDQVCHFDQFYQDLGHIIYKSNDFTLTDDTGIYSCGTYPDHSYSSNINDHIRNRV